MARTHPSAGVLAMAGINLEAGMGLTVLPNFDTGEVGIELFANLGSKLSGGVVVSSGALDNVPVIRDILRLRFGLPFAYDLEGEVTLKGVINNETRRNRLDGVRVAGAIRRRRLRQ